MDVNDRRAGMDYERVANWTSRAQAKLGVEGAGVDDLGYRKVSPTIGCTRCLQDPSREANAHSMVLESSDPQ